MLQGQISQLTMAAAAASELVGSERDRKWRNQRKWKSNRKNSICNCARESGKFEMDFAIFARWMHTAAWSRAELESNEPASAKRKIKIQCEVEFAICRCFKPPSTMRSSRRRRAKKKSLLNLNFIEISSSCSKQMIRRVYLTFKSLRIPSTSLLFSLLCWKATSIL